MSSSAKSSIVTKCEEEQNFAPKNPLFHCDEKTEFQKSLMERVMSRSLRKEISKQSDANTMRSTNLLKRNTLRTMTTGRVINPHLSLCRLLLSLTYVQSLLIKASEKR
jgi:hypothetical protein